MNDLLDAKGELNNTRARRRDGFKRLARAVACAMLGRAAEGAIAVARFLAEMAVIARERAYPRREG